MNEIVNHLNSNVTFTKNTHPDIVTQISEVFISEFTFNNKEKWEKTIHWLPRLAEGLTLLKTKFGIKYVKTKVNNLLPDLAHQLITIHYQFTNSEKVAAHSIDDNAKNLISNLTAIRGFIESDKPINLYLINVINNSDSKCLSILKKQLELLENIIETNKEVQKGERKLLLIDQDGSKLSELLFSSYNINQQKDNLQSILIAETHRFIFMTFNTNKWTLISDFINEINEYDTTVGPEDVKSICKNTSKYSLRY